MGFSEWIVSKTIRDHNDISNPRVRTRYGMLEGIVSIVVNVLLFSVKLFLGISIRSIALIADSVHTLFDSATSICVILGFRAAEKPSDESHPFGHGRFESIATLIISVLLMVTGFELLKGAAKTILKPEVTVAGTWTIVIISATMVVKELLARFSRKLGIMIDSKTLIADYLHHRSDVYTTIPVVVGLVVSNLGFASMDGLMGVIVAGIIMYSGYLAGKEAVSPLLGEAPSAKAILEVKNTSEEIKGVLGVHDIIFHSYGQTKLVSLHIEVPADMVPMELHAISEKVEDAVEEKIRGTVIAHIDPVNRDHPIFNDVEALVKELVQENDSVDSFHCLRIIGADKLKAVFDIVLNCELDEKKIKEITGALKDRVKAKFSNLEVVITVDPKFVYNP